MNLNLQQRVETTETLAGLFPRFCFLFLLNKQSLFERRLNILYRSGIISGGFTGAIRFQMVLQSDSQENGNEENLIVYSDYT